MGKFAIILALCGCADYDVSRQLGAECESSEDCASLCLSEANGYPGGFCTQHCASDDDCSQEAGCASEQGGVCLFLCRDDVDCEFLGGSDGRIWSCGERDAIDGTTVFLCVGDA